MVAVKSLVTGPAPLAIIIVAVLELGALAVIELADALILGVSGSQPALVRRVDAEVAAVVGVAAAERSRANPLAFAAVEGAAGSGSASQDGHCESGEERTHFVGVWK